MTAPAQAYAAEQGIRRYHVEGMYPHPISVTSLIKVIAPATNLTKWIDKKLISAAIDAYSKSQDPEVSLQVGLQARWGGSEEADLGTSVHYLCEVSDLKALGRQVDPHPVTDTKKCLTYVRQWEKAREEHDMQILATEVTLVNEEFGYAGTADRVVIVPAISDLPLILDLKSGKNLYNDVALQCAALAHCTQILYDDGSLGPIPWDLDKVNGIAAHVRPRSCRLVPLDIEKAWPYFQPLAMLAKWKTETVKVRGEPLEPDEELSMRANLRLRMKLLPSDLSELVRACIKSVDDLADGNTNTWTVEQCKRVSDLFEPFEAQSRERKEAALDRWGSGGMMELRTRILGVTNGRTSLLDDLTATEIDALVGQREPCLKSEMVARFVEIDDNDGTDNAGSGDAVRTAGVEGLSTEASEQGAS